MTMLDTVTILERHNHQTIKHCTEYKVSGSAAEENTLWFA